MKMVCNLLAPDHIVHCSLHGLIILYVNTPTEIIVSKGTLENLSFHPVDIEEVSRFGGFENYFDNVIMVSTFNI